MWSMTSKGITLRTQMKVFNKLHYVLDDVNRYCKQKKQLQKRINKLHDSVLTQLSVVTKIP